LRSSVGGVVYHVLNRGNGRQTLFEDEGDYTAFEEVMGGAYARTPVRIVAYCLMPNHWHLVVWPRRDGELSTFMQWLTVTHTQRWHAHHRTSGTGHLYQGRFKSFPVQRDAHFLTLTRYVERNPLRANLVERAEEWRWSSLWRRSRKGDGPGLLVPPGEWPARPPRDWLAVVNRAENPKELEALRRCVSRGCPYGEGDWVLRTAKRLGLETTLRPRGRPRRQPGADPGARKDS